MDEPVYHYAPRPPRWYETVTGRIVFLNILMFIVQIWQDDAEKEFTYTWALSLPGLQEGHWWQLLTFQVLHGGPIHLLINCLLIHVLGRALEEHIGKWRLFVAYWLGGVAGGLLEMGIKWYWPEEFNSAILGASAGACALVGVFATLFPRQRLRVLIFFVIPVAMSARTMLVLTILISVVGMTGLIHDGIAHAGHLGGIIWGVLYTWLRLRQYMPPPPMSPPPLPYP